MPTYWGSSDATTDAEDTGDNTRSPMPLLALVAAFLILLAICGACARIGYAANRNSHRRLQRAEAHARVIASNPVAELSCADFRAVGLSLIHI